MKRLFYQTVLYDYSSMEECAKHIREMEKRGWKVKLQEIDDNGCEWYVYKNGQDKLPYSAEFYKQM